MEITDVLHYTNPYLAKIKEAVYNQVVLVKTIGLKPMKKIAIAIILFCTLYSAYCLDYRHVIFGNNYQNILEIDADTFFEQYPEVKETEFGRKPYVRVIVPIGG